MHTATRKMKEKDIINKVELPEGVSATADNGIMTVKGPNGEL